MKLFIIPVSIGLIFIGSLVGIHQIYVSGPEKLAAAAKSRAAEARAKADTAIAQEKSAKYAVEIEKVKGNNAAHIIATTALADVAVATSKNQPSSIAPLQIGSAIIAFCFFIACFKWFRAEKRAEALEHILITHANPKIIESLALMRAVNSHERLRLETTS